MNKISNAYYSNIRNCHSPQHKFGNTRKLLGTQPTNPSSTLIQHLNGVIWIKKMPFRHLFFYFWGRYVYLWGSSDNYWHILLNIWVRRYLFGVGFYKWVNLKNQMDLKETVFKFYLQSIVYNYMGAKVFHLLILFGWQKRTTSGECTCLLSSSFKRRT